MKQKIDNLLASIRKNQEDAQSLIKEIDALHLDENTTNTYIGLLSSVDVCVDYLFEQISKEFFPTFYT